MKSPVSDCSTVYRRGWYVRGRENGGGTSCKMELFLSSTVTVSKKQCRKFTLTGYSYDGEQTSYVMQQCMTWSPRTYTFTCLY
jgi:hypothetical protein